MTKRKTTGRKMPQFFDKAVEENRARAKRAAHQVKLERAVLEAVMDEYECSLDLTTVTLRACKALLKARGK